VDNTNKVLTAMNSGCIYRPCDLTEQTGLSVDEIRRCLKILARGMIVETTETNEYKRKSLYQSKQEALF